MRSGFTSLSGGSFNNRGIIEDQVKTLEETQTAWQIAPKSTESGVAEEQTSHTQISETPSPEYDLLAQLRHLLAFMATHLRDQLHLYEDAQAGKPESIQLPDL